MSARTLPGPTDGNWSMSPMNSTRAWPQARPRSLEMNMSGIELSSMLIIPVIKGLAALRSNPLMSGRYSSRRWMVLPSKPVVSVMRLAAFPVGAASENSRCSSVRTRIRGASFCHASQMTRSVWVFPVPGPPVRMAIRSLSAMMAPSRCSDDSLIPSAACASSTAWMTAPMPKSGTDPSRSLRMRCRANSFSARLMRVVAHALRPRTSVSTMCRGVNAES